VPGPDIALPGRLGGLRYVQQRQHHGYCCHVLALLNALIFFGEKSVPVQGYGWMQLLAMTKCRYCMPEMFRVREAAEHLNLRMTPIESDIEIVRENIPVMLLIQVDEATNHAALVVEMEENWLSLANYRGLYGDSRVDVRRWDRLRLHGDISYAITRE